MTYYVKGTLVCDLCGESLREDTHAYSDYPIAQPNEIVNYQIGKTKATLCDVCLEEMSYALKAYSAKLREQGRLVGFQSYHKWNQGE